MDWIHTQHVPRKAGTEYEVWLGRDEVRRCAMNPAIDFSNLFYTDCTNPLQNAAVPEERILAWRPISYAASSSAYFSLR